MSDKNTFPLYRAASCGLLAMLVGIGIARFGYSPLVPALVAAHWFTAAAAFWLGATNLLGYLIGAAGMRAWHRPIYTRAAVTTLMGLTAFSLIASAWLPPWWAVPRLPNAARWAGSLLRAWAPA